MELKLSCLKTQHSGGRYQTQDLSLRSCLFFDNKCEYISIQKYSTSERFFRGFKALPSSLGEVQMICVVSHMSPVMRKLVFGVSDQLSHKPACIITEESKRLEILDIRRRGILLVTTLSVMLICVFVFA